MGIRRTLVLAALMGLLLWTSSAQGATGPANDVLVKQALAQMERENYDEALQALKEAWDKGPRTPKKAYYLGKVYRLRLDYPQARRYLEEAVQLDSGYLEARLLLADTLVALNQGGAAKEHLKILEAAGYQPGSTAMLQGLVAFKEKRYDEALASFRKAQADPKLAQDAKMQMSLALAAQNKMTEARKYLDEAIALDPRTPAADLGQRYVTGLDRRSREYGPLRFHVALGFDYDSNVTLQPGDPAAAQQVAGRGDVVFSQIGNFEYIFRGDKPFSLRTQYLFYQNFHHRLTKFDLLSHTFGLTPTYTLKSGRFYLPFTYNYTDVEADKYYTAFALTPFYLHLLSPKWGVEVGGRWSRKYYWFPIAVPQDDRSGKNFGTSLGLYYFFKNQEAYLQARFSYEHDNTTGSNWSNSSYRFLFAGLYPVTKNLQLSAFLDLILQPYEHRFTNGTPAVFPKRDDKILVTGLQATYLIYKGLEFNVHYYFVKDSSNIALYDYDRHIVGCQLGYRY